MVIKDNKKVLLGILLFSSVIILASLLSVSFAYAQSTASITSSGAEVSVCCEKTKSGAYCQNSPSSQCNPNFRSTATSCEATSFCKKGCCYASDEGICMENTPEEACKASNGVWSNSPTCSIPQCDLGCCVLGDQAAFVPLVRCKKLSALYGLQTDFRTSVPDEISCIQIAQAQDKGACVYESEFTRTCKFTTRGECDSTKLNGLTNASVEFYKDYLCSAEDLNTNCGKSTKTSCVDGKSGVYFLDSCGNPANVYDASKINDITYWTKVVKPEESCGTSGGSNSGSKNCGNCDYLSGSLCAPAAKSEKPSYGDYICKSTDCKKTSNEKDYRNGESWCYYDNKKPTTDSVGSRHFRHICVMGEEIVEPCEDFRNEVCTEGNLDGGFSQAGCTINRWQNCVLQNSTDDCENSDKIDCKWTILDLNNPDLKKGLTGKLTSTLSKVPIVGGILGNKEDEKKNATGKCVPKIAPGLEFWGGTSSTTSTIRTANSGNTASQQCSLGDQSCIVKYTKKLYQSDWQCAENCECLEEQAKVLANNYCSSLGDCGAKANYIGKFVDKGYKITITKDGSQEVKESGQGGGSAQPSNGGGGAFGQPNPPSGSQEFAGPQGTNAQGGNNFQGPQTSTGNIIQGLVVRTYNKVIGAE